MKFLFSLLLFVGLSAHSSIPNYPDSWWAPVTDENIPSWEILPQSAEKGKEVILSKRNELGVFSNLAPTPFVYRGKKYASLEGLWQSMKYPEGPNDPRATAPGLTWKYTRDQVAMMAGFMAKDAGDLANANMKKMGIEWVSFENERMAYKSTGADRHYAIIFAASQQKVSQNPSVRDLLKATGDLVLRPDHKVDANAPPAYKYFEIYMKIRDTL